MATKMKSGRHREAAAGIGDRPSGHDPLRPAIGMGLPSRRERPAQGGARQARRRAALGFQRQGRRRHGHLPDRPFHEPGLVHCRARHPHRDLLSSHRPGVYPRPRADRHRRQGVLLGGAGGRRAPGRVPGRGRSALSAGQHLPAGTVSGSRRRSSPTRIRTRSSRSPASRRSKGRLEDYHLYVLLAPHLGNRGAGNSAWLGDHRGVPMLFARRGGQALALACSAPWIRGSAGYVGASDGWEDLSRHKQLTWAYDRAEDGNVALTGEVDIAACGGVFALAVGFGPDDAEAGHRALASLMDDSDDLQAEYVRGWQEWQATLAAPEAGRARAGATSTGSARPSCERTMPRASRARSSPACRPPGASHEVTKREHAGTGGYHLVWPRDLVESAGGLLAAGARPRRLRVLRYLRATQMAEGHWPQNMWVSSAQFWTRNPARRDGISRSCCSTCSVATRGFRPTTSPRFWPMVRRAAGYIVRSGPSTQQDRWENAAGIHSVHPGGRDRRPADRRRAGR